MTDQIIQTFVVSAMYKNERGDVRFIPHFLSDDLTESVDLAEKISLTENVAVVFCGNNHRKYFRNGKEVF